MKTINRKPLYIALAGLTALGAVGTAQAVSVSANGLGQALVYPYYTVKGVTNPYNTLISIVNTTASTKAVKIRFREGKASVEVLDFAIFLSPYDMWTAALEPSSSGGVKLFTNDKSCTIPTIPALGVEFRNSAYVGDAAKDNSLARLREGYFEVIEMATFTDGSSTATNSLHDSTGTPENCAKVTTLTAQDEQSPPQGGLTGTASLVSPGTGLNAATDPTVLVNLFAGPKFFPTTSRLPDLSDADQWSTTATDDGNTVWASWTQGADASSAALMKTAIINEYVLDSGTASATDWVVTFPTKSFYVPNSGASVAAPFQSKLSGIGSCDDILVNAWDREEQNRLLTGDDFSPAAKAPLCWEANVVTFDGKNLFNSTNTLSVNPGFVNGWARMDFSASGAKLTAASAVFIDQAKGSPPSTFQDSVAKTFVGLPVIGFAVQTFRPSLTSSYAGTFYHRFLSGADAGPR